MVLFYCSNGFGGKINKLFIDEIWKWFHNWRKKSLRFELNKTWTLQWTPVFHTLYINVPGWGVTIIVSMASEILGHRGPKVI